MSNPFAPIKSISHTPDLWEDSKEAWSRNPKVGFENWVGSWRVNTSRTMRDSSFQTYWAMASVWLAFLEEKNTTLLNATAENAQEFFTKHSLEPVSRRRYLQLLDKWYWHLITRGITDSNPVQLQFLHEYALPEHFPVGLNKEQVQRLIALFPKENNDWRDLRDKAIIAYLIGSGLRVSALCSLTLPLDNLGKVNVPKSGVHEGYTSWMIDRSSISGIKLPWRQWATQWEDFKKDKAIKSPYVITSTLSGSAMSRSGIFRRVKPYIELASGGDKLPQTGPGLLRNTYGRLLFCAGTPLKNAQSYLGHEQSRATKRYLASSEDFYV